MKIKNYEFEDDFAFEAFMEFLGDCFDEDQFEVTDFMEVALRATSKQIAKADRVRSQILADLYED